MYQTPVMSATSDSRTAGPVCSTRDAMRPAKSFWKNDHDWRATCQWFCQRIMLETLAEIAWLATRFWPVSASGRATSSTAAMPSSVSHDVSHSRAGSLEVTKLMIRPMNTGIIESSSATRNPVMNSATNRPLAWRAKCQ
jgi:hypothetical protein